MSPRARPPHSMLAAALVVYAAPTLAQERGGTTTRAPAQSTSAAREQTPPAPSRREDPSEPAEARLLVRGSPARERSATEFNLGIGTLAQVPRTSGPQLINLAPGAWLANDDTEGHAYSVSMRGFGGDDGRDIAFSLDGVPLNDESNPEGTGYADTYLLLPELVDRLDVTEGVADPRQGNFAVAGSIDFRLALRQRGATARTTLGAFGYRRLTTLWGPGTNEQTFVGMDTVHSDGYGARRDNDRATALAQYAFSLGHGVTARLFAALYWSRWNSAGVLREDDVDAGRVDFFGTYSLARGQGGASRRALSAFALDYRGEHDRAELRAYAAARGFEYRENFTGRIDDPEEGDLTVMRYDGGTLGASGFYRYAFSAFGRTHEVEAGGSVRHDRYTATSGALNAYTLGPQAAADPEDSTLGLAVTHVGAYADLTLRVLDRLVVRGGARADLFSYDLDAIVIDETSLTPERAVRSALAARVGPKASVEVTLGRGFTLVGSYGTGFRSPNALDVALTGAVPFTSVFGEEVGLRYALPRAAGRIERVTAAAAAFHTHVDEDSVFDPLSGRAVTLGPTERVGATVYLRAQPTAWLDVAASCTYTHAWSAADALEGAVRAGAPLPYIPPLVARADAAVDVPAGTLRGAPVRFRGALGASLRGEIPLLQGPPAAPVFLLDASAGVRVGAVTFDLSARNLLDARWHDVQFEYASNFTESAQASPTPARHFTAGMPLNLYGTLSLTF